MNLTGLIQTLTFSRLILKPGDILLHEPNGLKITFRNTTSADSAKLGYIDESSLDDYNSFAARPMNGATLTFSIEEKKSEIPESPAESPESCSCFITIIIIIILILIIIFILILIIKFL